MKSVWDTDIQSSMPSLNGERLNISIRRSSQSRFLSLKAENDTVWGRPHLIGRLLYPLQPNGSNL